MAKINDLLSEKLMVRRNYLYYVGIDTGMTTGVACWWKEQKHIGSLGSYMLHQAMDLIRRWHRERPGAMLIRMEDARLRTWIPRMPNISRELGRREGAGYVKAHAAIWEDFLEDLGIDYELVAPKNNKTKVSAEYFKSLTGYDKPTNEHGRDACMLVYGL